MDWKELGQQVVKLGAPLLGGALGGPGGAALGSLLASAIGGDADDPQALAQAVQGNPDAAIKLREIETAHQQAIAQLRVQQEANVLAADTARIQAVNQTMQSEAKSEHWAQWSWRPFNGFMFGTTLFGVYFLLPLVDRPVPSIPEWVWMAWATVLGVTAWHRGVQKRLQVGRP